MVWLPASWIGEPVALVGGRIVAAVAATVATPSGQVRLRYSIEDMQRAQERALQYIREHHERDSTS